MNWKQTDITTGKQIRHLRTQSGMTQEELAGELNVTRQALSNWERDVNEPDLNTLKKICFLFGVHMDDFAKEVITKMETCEKKEMKVCTGKNTVTFLLLHYGIAITEPPALTKRTCHSNILNVTPFLSDITCPE